MFDTLTRIYNIYLELFKCIILYTTKTYIYIYIRESWSTRGAVCLKHNFCVHPDPAKQQEARTPQRKVPSMHGWLKFGNTVI